MYFSALQHPYIEDEEHIAAFIGRSRIRLSGKDMLATFEQLNLLDKHKNILKHIRMPLLLSPWEEAL